MDCYSHGGDLAAIQEADGATPLDCSANLNPLGMPPEVARAARAAVARCIHYPDPLCRELAAGVARRDGVEAEQALCGGGAADLIYRLALALPRGRALLFEPTFSEYGHALACAGWEIRRSTLCPEENFALTHAHLAHVEGADLVFLCNPNNPTGSLIDPPVLEELLEGCARRGIRVAVDECFWELACGGPGLAPRVGEFPNLIVLRAFTKSYAMPGLRLGYCLCADVELLERMRRCGPPWSVSAPAQAAGLAALDCPDWPGKARELLEQERPRLAAGLAGLGLEVWPGAANFLLVRAPGRGDLGERLLEQGVLIRPCGNFYGLSQDYYRTCVGRPGQNRRLLRALREVL